MKAYCINLDDRPDRMMRAEAEFRRLGMNVERVTAVDGKTPSVISEAREIPLMWTGQKMSPAAFACLQSHRKIWRMLLESGAKHAMVLEDDLYFSKGFSAYLEDAWVPPNADIVKLETFGTRAHIDRVSQPIFGGRRLHRLRSTHVGAGAYILSAAAAERLLANTSICGDPVDEVIFNDKLSMFSTLVIYQMVPAPAVQGKRPIANLDSKGKTDTWIRSSLEERTVPSLELGLVDKESYFSRLTRRAFGELLSFLKRTKYVVIPHG